MGMLQLKGVVSGFGKGLQQGLQQTQQYMSQSLLLEERDKNERERQRLTFAHDEGMLQKRLEGERETNRLNADTQNKYQTERDDRMHSQAIDRLEMQQDESARQSRIQREFERTRDAEKAKADLEKELRGRGYKAEDAKAEAAVKLAEWRRERIGKKEDQQFEAGLKLTEKTMDLQKPHGGSSGASKLDPTTNAQLTIYKDRIGRLEDEMNNVMTTKARRVEIQKEIADLEKQQNTLVGIQSSKPDRPGIRWPE